MKLNFNRISWILILFAFVFSCEADPQEYPQPKKPKYIFLFIGDGMGVNHVSLSEGYIVAQEDEIGMSGLKLTEFPYFGLCTTFSKNSNITDSGAAGSAIACGEKADNGVISYFPIYADTIPPKSIAKIAHEQDFKVGIITSVSIDHATPAVFYAVNESRSNYYEIGLELSESNFEFFGGGGFKYPTGADQSQTDLYTVTEENGYFVSQDLSNLSTLNCNVDKAFIRNPSIMWAGDMPYAIDRDIHGGYSLADFVDAGIDFLDNEDGFFIMVEGGKIDWAAHNNDAATIVNEVIDFDNALQVAYNFYLENPEETLIIVTADHETGGLSLGNNQNGYNGNYQNIQLQKCSLGYISSKLSDYKESNSTYSIDEVLNIANEHFFTDTIELSEIESQELDIAFNYYFYGTTSLSSEELYERYGGLNPLAVAFVNIVNTRSSSSFTTWSHTGTRVPVYTIGARAGFFSGGLDNTDFHRLILEIMEW